MFSSRLPEDLAANRVTQTLDRLRAAGTPIVDLTETNPTRVALRYPPDSLEPLANRAGLIYEPQPFGLPAARQAVAAALARRGVPADSDRLILTSSTSEAYSLLFKLLCDPGDAVLVPRPSYPLFEHLTRLEGIAPAPYPLEYHGRWRIDLDELSRAIGPHTRAVLLVNPNNPTGSYVKRAELDAIAATCRDASLALIGDEVFNAYPLDPGAPTVSSVLDQNEVLTFSLGGLSKAAGLPQVKLGWTLVHGPEELVEPALARLALICDTYLSVSTPVQHAVPALLEVGQNVSVQIAERIRENYGELQRLAADHSASRILRAEGGWYAVIQVPATRSEETLVLELLERDRVLVHPGYFFDFPREAFLVLSLLPEPDRFREGVRRMLTRVENLS